MLTCIHSHRGPLGPWAVGWTPLQGASSLPSQLVVLNFSCTLKSHEDLYKHWYCGLTPRDADLFGLGYTGSWGLRMLCSPDVSNVLRRLKTTEIDAQGLESSKTIYSEKIILTVESKQIIFLINLTNVQKCVRKLSWTNKNHTSSRIGCTGIVHVSIVPKYYINLM